MKKSMFKSKKFFKRVFIIFTYVLIFCIIGNNLLSDFKLNSVIAVTSSVSVQEKINTARKIKIDKYNIAEQDIVKSANVNTISNSNPSIPPAGFDKYLNLAGGKAKVTKIMNLFVGLTDFKKAQTIFDSLSDDESTALLLGSKPRYTTYESDTQYSSQKTVSNTYDLQQTAILKSKVSAFSSIIGNGQRCDNIPHFQSVWSWLGKVGLAGYSANACWNSVSIWSNGGLNGQTTQEYLPFFWGINNYSGYCSIGRMYYAPAGIYMPVQYCSVGFRISVRTAGVDIVNSYKYHSSMQAPSSYYSGTDTNFSL